MISKKHFDDVARDLDVNLTSGLTTEEAKALADEAFNDQYEAQKTALNDAVEDAKKAKEEACKSPESAACKRATADLTKAVNARNSYPETAEDAKKQEQEAQRKAEEEKQAAVADYLSGVGSLHDICKKYKISDTHTLRQWISLYNGHKELKASGTGGSSLMTEGRKTTFEERVEIASYCISHDHNYAETSEKFKVSYQQARNYTIKYKTGGVAALQDNRGKRKQEDSLTEMEKLRAELKLEKAKRQRAEMELSFLKKLEEIERRRG